MVKGYKDYSRTSIVAQGRMKQNLDFITKGLNIRGLNSTTVMSIRCSRFYNPNYYALGEYNSKKYLCLTLLNPGGRKRIS